MISVIRFVSNTELFIYNRGCACSFLISREKLLNVGVIKVHETWKLILTIHLGVCQISVFS